MAYITITKENAQGNAKLEEKIGQTVKLGDFRRLERDGSKSEKPAEAKAPAETPAKTAPKKTARKRAAKKSK